MSPGSDPENSDPNEVAVTEDVGISDNEFDQVDVPAPSADEMVDSAQYFELQNEFNSKFESFEVVEAAPPNYLLRQTDSKSRKSCKDGFGPGKAPRVRFPKLMEYQYYHPFLTPFLYYNFVLKEGPRCFWLEDETPDETLAVCIKGPNDARFVIPRNSSDEAFALCMKPKKLEVQDSSTVFFTPIYSRPDSVEQYSLTNAQLLHWTDMVGDPTSSDPARREGKILRAIFGNFNNIESTPEIGDWKSYIAFYIQVFGSAQPILDMLNSGKYAHCNAIANIVNQQLTNIVWKDLYTAYFGAWLDARCSIQQSNRNNEFFSDMITNVTTPSLTENMRTRGQLISWYNECSSQVFPQLMIDSAANAYCKSVGVLEYLPVAGTMTSAADALDTCVRKDCTGTDFQIQLAGTAISAFFDIAGSGAPAKTALLNGFKILRATKFAIRNPNRFGRVLMAQAYRRAKTALEFLPSAVRVLSEAKSNVRGLFQDAAYNAATDRLTKSLKTIIGDVADPDQAAALLNNAGILSVVREFPYSLSKVATGTSQLVEIVGLKADAAATWQRLDAIIRTLQVSGRSGREVPYRLLLDVSAGRKLGGMFVGSAGALVLRPESIRLNGRTDATFLHEIIHLMRTDRVLRGALSQYLGEVTGILGPRVKGLSNAYKNGFRLDEIKAFEATLQARVNEIAALLRKHPELGNQTVNELASKQTKLYAAKILGLTEDAEKPAAMAGDLYEWARAARAGENRVQFFHLSEMPREVQAEFPNANLYFAVLDKDKVTVNIPLTYQSNLDEAMELLKSRGIGPAEAQTIVLKDILEKQLDKLVTDSAAMKTELAKWFTERSDPFFNFITYSLRPEKNELTLNEFESQLRDMVTALKRASPDNYVKRFEGK